MDNLKEVILQTLQDIDEVEEEKEENNTNCNEEFLQKLREKILVLFEGLQSPNINNLDKKLDLTINFLEYTLAEIDKQLSK